MIDLSEILFYLVAALILFGAAGGVLSRNIVYAAVGLLLTMLGTAGLFILVFAEFLALVQVLIYGGAVVVLILFAIMLVNKKEALKPVAGPLSKVAEQYLGTKREAKSLSFV